MSPYCSIKHNLATFLPPHMSLFLGLEGVLVGVWLYFIQDSLIKQRRDCTNPISKGHTIYSVYNKPILKWFTAGVFFLCFLPIYNFFIFLFCIALQWYFYLFLEVRSDLKTVLQCCVAQVHVVFFSVYSAFFLPSCCQRVGTWHLHHDRRSKRCSSKGHGRGTVGF